MQHFLIRAFRLPALIAMVFGITLSGQVLAQQSLSNMMFFDGVGPQGGLVSDGRALYGAASGGGYPAPGGLLYRLALDSSSITTIYEYGRLEVWTGANPSSKLLLGSDGNLYGTTLYTSIDMLRGGQPIGTGTIFRVGLDGKNYTRLHEFEGLTRDPVELIYTNTYGSYPQGALIEGDENGVKYLYGTAFQGGPNGTGIVFKIRADGNGFAVLHNFAAITKKANPTGPLDFATNDDGAFKNPDGINPSQRLLQTRDGMLYGVTNQGGVNGTGVVFRLPVDGTAFDPFPFDVSPDNPPVTDTVNYGKRKNNTTGGYPIGGLVQQPAPGTMVYGTASGLGGIRGAPDDSPYNDTFGFGTVFRIDPTAAAPAIQFLVAFTGDVGPNSGTAPAGDLIFSAAGKLVGTTQSGGTIGGDTGVGTVFTVLPDGTNHVPECVFGASTYGAKGAVPSSGVIQTGDGGFYGTATQGGLGRGVIFKCGTPHGSPPLGVPPPIDNGGGVLPLWMIALMGTLLAVQLTQRGRRLRLG